MADYAATGGAEMMLDASAVVAFHDCLLAGVEGEALHLAGPWWRWIEEIHRCNAALWREEREAGSGPVTEGARRAVEALGRTLLAALEIGSPPHAAGRCSEIASAIVNRLSLLALKIHHLRRQAERKQADAASRITCGAQLEALGEQRADLAACLDRLLWEARVGAMRLRLHRRPGEGDPVLPPRGQQQVAGEVAVASTASPAAVDVLIPTCNRPGALAVTLTSLFAQSLRGLRIVISDQGERCEAGQAEEVQAALRLMRARQNSVELHRHLPRRGLAEQRHFLLEQARAPYVLFLDDDVVLEADLLERMLGVIREQGCGFVGSALIGMSYAGDERPHQQGIEFWEGRVEPEAVTPGGAAWNRHHLHSAANLYHLQCRLGLTAASQRLYRVAWVGGCVLFDATKLREAGGFDFWRELPPEHCGEDVYAQLRVMARHGGCGLIPSGAYHQELPTTVPHREVDAPRALRLE